MKCSGSTRNRQPLSALPLTHEIHRLGERSLAHEAHRLDEKCVSVAGVGLPEYYLVMAPRRELVCAVCGLVGCAHLAVLGVTEAAHPHQPEARSVVETAALPPEPDHGHRDVHRPVRFRVESVAVSGTSSGAWAHVGGNQLAPGLTLVYPPGVLPPSFAVGSLESTSR